MNQGIVIRDYTLSPATTFFLPENNDRKHLQPGDFAKVVFAAKHGDHEHEERMWVIVEQVTAPGKYAGELNNDPVVVPMICGEKVEFEWNNVIGILRSN